MFQLSRASQDHKQALLAAADLAPLFSPHLLTLEKGLVGTLPKGYAHDLSRTTLGRGLDAFHAARQAFQRWEQFDLEWVKVTNKTASILPGELVAVEAHTAMLWSISVNRIVEIVDTATRFGFLYTTTAVHVEQGQERFVIEFDAETGSVYYLIEAVSRPRHILALMAYPFSRAMQRRFAKDSHVRMSSCVLSASERRAHDH